MKHKFSSSSFPPLTLFSFPFCPFLHIILFYNCKKAPLQYTEARRVEIQTSTLYKPQSDEMLRENLIPVTVRSSTQTQHTTQKNLGMGEKINSIHFTWKKESILNEKNTNLRGENLLAPLKNIRWKIVCEHLTICLTISTPSPLISHFSFHLQQFYEEKVLSSDTFWSRKSCNGSNALKCACRNISLKCILFKRHIWLQKSFGV